MTRQRSPVRIAIASLTALLAGISVDVVAFGEAGHRVIGRVAELHLSNSRAMQEVMKILRPQETLADASVWADTIRSATYEDEDTAAFRLEHPAHDTYHYTNVPFQAERYDPDAPGAHVTDAVRMASECIRVLKGTSRMFAPREALRLLAHYAGDMHQPLHTGNTFVSAQGPLRFVVPEGAAGWRTTLGGNALRYGPEDTFNLHSYWDSRAVSLAMGKEDVATYAARLVKELPIAVPWRNDGNVDAWPAQWATEALVYAKDVHKDVRLTAYLGPDADRRVAHRWRIELPPGYDDLARQRIRTQLAKGGYRLAATLKAIWPGAP